MADEQRNPVEKDRKFVETVRKYLAGEKLSPKEERIIAYGYTAAARGQREELLRPGYCARQEPTSCVSRKRTSRAGHRAGATFG